ncbi:MAG: hypothetical protein ACI4SO_00275, partial [Muribaculaceae bacterium]
YSLFTILYSLFTIHYSLFSILYSLLSIHCSLFSILYYLLSIHYSLPPSGRLGEHAVMRKDQARSAATTPGPNYH